MQRSGTFRKKDRDTKDMNSTEGLDRTLTNQYKRQILTILLDENMCLSAFIVSNTKISDSSQPSRYFMEIIHFACKERMEDFIFQLLEKKIQAHYSKIETVQDMKNVLRDNSLIMLMILQYIKDSCENYFKLVFGEIMEEMLPNLEHLIFEEDDKNGKDIADKLIQLNVSKIVNAVVSKVDVLPEPIYRIFNVLRIKITSALTKMPEDDVEQDLHASSLKRKESFATSDHGLDIFKEDEDDSTESTNTIVRKSSLARKTSVRAAYTPQVEITEEMRSTVGEPRKDEPEVPTSSEEKKNSTGTLRRTKMQGKNAHRKRSKAVANTVVDTILASFLFLRILVPAITSPIQHKITNQEISSAKSRGLIQIGKALVSMCNELDLAKSSEKTSTLTRIASNNENKAKIKEFVHEVSIVSRNEKDASSSLFALADIANIEDDKIPIHDEFVQFLSNSIPSLDFTIKESQDKEPSVQRLFDQLQSVLSQYSLAKQSRAISMGKRTNAIGDKAKEGLIKIFGNIERNSSTEFDSKNDNSVLTRKKTFR